MDVLDSIKLSATSCLPSPSNRKSIFRWNEDVQPFKENAMFWHSIWLSASRPVNNEKEDKSLSSSDMEKQKDGRMHQEKCD